MFAMAASKDKAIIEETLGMTLKEGEVSIQNVVYFFSGTAGNSEGRRILSKFFEENYDKV